MKKLQALILVLLLAVVAAACGTAKSGSDASSAPKESSSAPAASASSANGEASKGKKIAYFSAGASNNYLKNAIEHAEKVAKDLGMEIDIFDGRFDPLTQLNQIQNAIATNKYDGFVIEAVDGNQLCKIATKDAVAKGIAISAINIELCGVTDTAPEGTLTFVGGQSVATYQEIVQKIFKDKPEGGKMVAIGGPATGTPYLNFKKALDIEMPKHPEWTLVGMHSTDYTANQAFQVAQNVIQANKDLDVIFSNYSGMSVGVVKAKQAAKRDAVKIYDFGGDQWAFDAVDRGDIQQTVVMLPLEEVQRGIEALDLHFNGKDVPKFYDLNKEPILPGTMHVEKSNIAQFKEKGLPEY
jgi:ribose transport system substrate-binding protein